MLCPKCCDDGKPSYIFCPNCGHALRTFTAWPLTASPEFLAFCQAWNTGIHSALGQVNATGTIHDWQVSGIVRELINIARLMPRRLPLAQEDIAEAYIEFFDRIMLAGK